MQLSAEVPTLRWRDVATKGSDQAWLRAVNRFGHSVTLVGHSVYLLGGAFPGYQDTPGTLFSRLYVLNLETQRWEHQDLPEVIGQQLKLIQGHSGTLVQDRIYFIGGVIKNIRNNSEKVYCLDLITKEFSEVETFGAPKRGPVSEHSADLLPESEEIIVYGGESDDFSLLADPLFSFNSETMTWTKLTWKGRQPALRGGHATFLLGKKLYIYGGFGMKWRTLGDLHVLDFERNVPVFIEIKVSIAPQSRKGSILFAVRGHLFLFGGVPAGIVPYRLNDFHRFDAAEGRWYKTSALRKELSVPMEPQRRSNHKAVVLHDRILAFGGINVRFKNYTELSFTDS